MLDLQQFDCVRVHDLQVQCSIGISSAERATLQPLNLCLDCYFEKRSVAEHDHIATCIDYDHLAEILYNFVLNRQFQVLERFVLLAIKQIFEQEEAVLGIVLEASKPQARTDANVSVKMERARSDII